MIHLAASCVPLGGSAVLPLATPARNVPKDGARMQLLKVTARDAKLDALNQWKSNPTVSIVW